MSLDKDAIAAAIDAVVAGQVIGLPTETVYGLAADAGQRDAVAEIYRIKGRPLDHPLIVHVAGVEEAKRWAHWSPRARRLTDACWPGPLTIVLPRREEAPAWACAGQPTVALRCPSHPVARAVLAGLVARAVFGLAAPSANRFGRISPTSSAHVQADLGDDVALVLDGGASEVGVESTIVDLTGAIPRILRPGHLTAGDLARVLDEPVAESDGRVLTEGPAGGPKNAGAAAAPDLVDPRGDDALPRMPGMLASHYAPLTPLFVLSADALGARARELAGQGERVAVWTRLPIGSPAPDAAIRHWELPAEPGRAEHQLYAVLRDMDATAPAAILVETPGSGAAWAAVNDRLFRASSRG